MKYILTITAVILTVSAAHSAVLVNVDKSTQHMTVLVDGEQKYDWPISTGKLGYDTPSGAYTASSMNEVWYSKQWDSAPMPHAIFFTKKGHAIHGSLDVKHLGQAASHGCVRLSPENATILYSLVKVQGLEKTTVVIAGQISSTQQQPQQSQPYKQRPQQSYPQYRQSYPQYQQPYRQPYPQYRPYYQQPYQSFYGRFF
jgi:hypothetical protein